MSLQVVSVLDSTLSQADHLELRALVDEAFGVRFDDHDWQHSCGGWRIIARDDEHVVATGAVVTRELFVDGVPYDVGYLEAVATAPEQQGHGYGTAVMKVATDLIATHAAFGALSTSAHDFYERLGWQRWRGRTYVIPADGSRPLRTADEDWGIMAWLPRTGPTIDVAADLWCHERVGDDW